MAGFAEAILLRRKYAVMKDAAGRPAPTADECDARCLAPTCSAH